MKKFAQMGVALISLIVTATACTSRPAPSNNALLKLALEATKESAPTKNCPADPPKLTPFPMVHLLTIRSPIEHIEQGDSYGTDLEIAAAASKSNAEKFTEYVKACDAGHAAEVKAYQRREEIRSVTLETVKELTGED